MSVAECCLPRCFVQGANKKILREAKCFNLKKNKEALCFSGTKLLLAYV